MTAKRDYYEILGIGRNSGDSDIKTAYRKMAMKYHPDRNPGDKAAEENFKEAAEAYEVLRDAQKRGIYDQYGHQGLEGSGFSGFGGFEDIFSSFGDIFEDFFGFNTGRRTQNRARRGSDLRYDLTLSFMEAAFGTETEIGVEKLETCPLCQGNGCEPGTQPERCKSCAGSGQVSRSQGFFTVRTSCPTCHGSGQSISKPCNRCRGKGQVVISKKVQVKIPAGVDTGSRLRLTGEGEGGSFNGPPGDLYVFIHVEPHEFFKRHNTDVLCAIQLSFIQAALGTKIKVPTLEGETELEIAKGTQPGDLLRLQGKGIASLRNNARGDQIIQVEIKTPTNMTKKQAELLEEFASLEENRFSKKLKSILRRNSSRATG